MAFKKWDDYHLLFDREVIAVTSKPQCSSWGAAGFDALGAQLYQSPFYHILLVSSVFGLSNWLWSQVPLPISPPLVRLCAVTSGCEGMSFSLFLLLDKPFVLVCVVDQCWKPKWHAWWQGDSCLNELPAVFSSPRTCVWQVPHIGHLEIAGVFPWSPKGNPKSFLSDPLFPYFFPFV